MSVKIDREFRLMLDLTMASDPSPLSEVDDDALRRFLDARARASGFEDWIEAFHRLPVGPCRHPMWWGTGMPAGHCDEPSWGNNYDHPRATNPKVWNAAHRREFPRWNALALACPRHGGPKASGTGHTQ